MFWLWIRNLFCYKLFPIIFFGVQLVHKKFFLVMNESQTISVYSPEGSLCCFSSERRALDFLKKLLRINRGLSVDLSVICYSREKIVKFFGDEKISICLDYIPSDFIVLKTKVNPTSPKSHN